VDSLVVQYKTIMALQSKLSRGSLLQQSDLVFHLYRVPLQRRVTIVHLASAKAGSVHQLYHCMDPVNACDTAESEHSTVSNSTVQH
jgi:hypothetical protein